ncbi:MAG: hypothetical protein ACT4P2_12980 [Pseudomonadota bacterium]
MRSSATARPAQRRRPKPSGCAPRSATARSPISPAARRNCAACRPRTRAGAGAGGKDPSFADLASGKYAGRTGASQITFDRNIGNQGLQFATVGGLVYRQAKAKGLGRELPDEWFLQDIRD